MGAIVAGAMLPRFLAQHSASATIPITMFVFLVGLGIIITVRIPAAYLVAGAILGFGNAGSRVARSSLMLHVVPNEVMGRVGGFYNVLDRVLRTLFVYAMSIIDVYGPTAGFIVLAAILAVALYGVVQTRATVREGALAPATA
jgi:MFS-type transporter involved in bile tolerance (Atg22 family)